MKKILLLILAIISLTSNVYIKHNDIYSKTLVKNITYLDDLKPLNSKRMRKTTISNMNLHLDISQDAYVLNKYALNLLDKDSAYNYLKNGGILIINDKEVTNNDLKQKIDFDIDKLDYNKDVNFYGFYVINNGKKNIVVNINLGYLNNVKDFYIDEKSIINEINKETIIEDIVSVAWSNSGISPAANVPLPDDGGGGDVINTNTSGQVIAIANTNNLLYLVNTDELACSYSIYTQVIDVMKIRDSLGAIHGVYDIVSTFTIDAEPEYQITNYGVRMNNSTTILDASYLNSTTSTTITLGGSIGFQGTILQGSLNNGISYTYNPDSQEILNDFPVGPNKYWYSDVIVPRLNASRKITTAIRIMNDSDYMNNIEYSRVEELYIEKIEGNNNTRYYMLDEYRKELGICWNYNGFVYSTTNMG